VVYKNNSSHNNKPMKNTSYLPSLQQCHHCKLDGWFCYTPNGGDYTTCPCCGQCDFLHKSETITHEMFNEIYDNDNDMRNLYNYCGSCRIIYETGCIHHVCGCTDYIYNCHFIKKYKNTLTNTEYDGMPLFDDSEDWYRNVNTIEVLELYCPHKNHKCSKSTYPNLHKCNL